MDFTVDLPTDKSVHCPVNVHPVNVRPVDVRPVDITVAICTYNGAALLPQLFEKLLSQVQTETFTWEILVVDNNSTDDTAQVVRNYQTHMGRSPLLRYAFEPRQGLAFARRRAIAQARGVLVGFLDDDNLPASTWVEAAYRFGQQYPKAGAYGSRIRGAYEVEPPQNFERIASFLPVTDRGNKPLLYDRRKGLLPPGAGIVIRKQAWLDSVPDLPVLKGVCGNSLSTKGEDIETFTYIRNAGWEIWYNPHMGIDHKIPARRLQREYLLRFFRGVGVSRYPTRMLRFAPWQRPFVLVGFMANDLRRLVQHYLKYRGRFDTDVVAACQLEMFRSSFLSPFYHWRHGFTLRAENSGLRTQG